MKLKIHMHSGECYEVEVEDYDVAEVHRQRNDNNVSSILFGTHDLSRINIRDIVPIEEPAENGENKE